MSPAAPTACLVHLPRVPGARIPVSLSLTVEGGTLLAELSARLRLPRRAVVEEGLLLLARQEGLPV